MSFALLQAFEERTKNIENVNKETIKILFLCFEDLLNRRSEENIEVTALLTISELKGAIAVPQDFLFVHDFSKISLGLSKCSEEEANLIKERMSGMLKSDENLSFDSFFEYISKELGCDNFHRGFKNQKYRAFDSGATVQITASRAFSEKEIKNKIYSFWKKEGFSVAEGLCDVVFKKGREEINITLTTDDREVLLTVF